MATESSIYRVEVHDGVAHVVHANGARGNAMGAAFWEQTPEVFETLAADDAVRAIVLSGEGKAFSYGLDLMNMGGEMMSLLGGTNLAKQRTRLLAKIGEMQASFNAIERCAKPVIAAVHGWCIGGAVEMIAACDVRVCSADAKFSLREAKVAIVADLGGLQRLPAIIGEGHTRELAFTARDIDAERALRIGLVNDIHPDREATVEAALAMAREIAANPPLVVQGVKRVMNHCRGKSVQEGLDYVATWNAAFLQSVDLGEALSAFVEKRPPRFKGE
jgi:enoyl-CoA hydratase